MSYNVEYMFLINRDLEGEKQVGVKIEQDWLWLDKC